MRPHSSHCLKSAPASYTVYLYNSIHIGTYIIDSQTAIHTISRPASWVRPGWGFPATVYRHRCPSSALRVRFRSPAATNSSRDVVCANVDDDIIIISLCLVRVRWYYHNNENELSIIQYTSTQVKHTVKACS